MHFYSTKSRTGKFDIKEAVLDGLAPDGGLFMPESIPYFGDEWIKNLPSLSLQEIGEAVARRFFEGSISNDRIKQICYEALNFDAPLQQLEDNLYVMELFHGPTLAFKDFGARFMARVMSYYLENGSQKLTILVATSGDTGSAVANGFLGSSNIDVVILYPSGKVSPIQELQLTTLGQNIQALEVDGTFDDCQRLVKTAFNDRELREKRPLGSANSINIARLIPQSFYYINAYARLNAPEELIFSIPSGNFGNLTAALIAKKMGIPIKRLIAATNVNDTVPEYLNSGTFRPRPSIRTISNAMDVGNPSNFDRLLCLVKDSHSEMQKELWGTSVTDEETEESMQALGEKYLLDPHGAVAYTAAKRYQALDNNTKIVFAETAHPAKFGDIVEHATGKVPPMPERLAEYLSRKKQAIKIKAEYSDLKDFLLL